MRCFVVELAALGRWCCGASVVAFDLSTGIRTAAGIAAFFWHVPGDARAVIVKHIENLFFVLLLKKTSVRLRCI